MDDRDLVHSIYSLRELPGELPIVASSEPPPHTIAAIRMREIEGDVRLTCACGVSLRRKTNDRLALAFARHAHVLTFDEMVTLGEMEAAPL